MSSSGQQQSIRPPRGRELASTARARRASVATGQVPLSRSPKRSARASRDKENDGESHTCDSGGGGRLSRMSQQQVSIAFGKKVIKPSSKIGVMGSRGTRSQVSGVDLPAKLPEKRRLSTAVRGEAPGHKEHDHRRGNTIRTEDVVPKLKALVVERDSTIARLEQELRATRGEQQWAGGGTKSEGSDPDPTLELQRLVRRLECSGLDPVDLKPLGVTDEEALRGEERLRELDETLAEAELRTTQQLERTEELLVMLSDVSKKLQAIP
ncbi:unnamed protein product [Discosporangium mesarthrocarpum]